MDKPGDASPSSGIACGIHAFSDCSDLVITLAFPRLSLRSHVSSFTGKQAPKACKILVVRGSQDCLGMPTFRPFMSHYNQVSFLQCSMACLGRKQPYADTEGDVMHKCSQPSISPRISLYKYLTTLTPVCIYDSAATSLKVTMLSSTGLVLLLSTFVAAQDYGYGGGGSTPTTTAPGASAAPVAPSDTPGNHNINVAAGGQFVFSPANITAAQGDKVTFWFPNNGLTHSVTQSSFAAPCTYLVATSNTSAGFDSGLTAGTQFTITIEDATKPIWFHCAQITHCGLGMVGSINAQTTNNTFDAFVSAAKAIGNNEKAESGSFVSGGVNAQAVGSPANTGSGAAPSTTTKSNSATRAGASIGMVLGGVLLAML